MWLMRIPRRPLGGHAGMPARTVPLFSSSTSESARTPAPRPRSLLVERERLHLGAAGVLARVGRVHVVEHRRGKVWNRLAGGDGLHDAQDRFVPRAR